MSGFLRMMLKVFKDNDPSSESDIDELRLMTLRNKIVAQARVTPQPMVPAHHLFAYQPVPSFGWRAGLALGSVLLLLGLWAGQHVKTPATQQVAQTQVDQHIAVMAMASPWEGWIEGGE